jgi:hypothetical protein
MFSLDFVRELRSAVSVERGEKCKPPPWSARESRHEGCLLHLEGIKRFERATMTRIGRCQIKSRQLYWQCFLAARQSRPAQKF